MVTSYSVVKVATIVEGASQGTSWVCAPASDQDENTDRVPVVAWGEGAARFIVEPAAHQNVCGAWYVTPSTSSSIPGGVVSTVTSNAPTA